MPKTTTEGVPSLVYETSLEAYWRVLLHAFSRITKRGASSPHGTPGGPQVEPKF